jgi:general secretion pathway protein M
MNRLTANALAWWEGRTLREQRMLAVMGLILLAVMIWLAVVRPAWAWRDSAADERARAENGLVLARQAATRLAVTTGQGSADIQPVVQAAGDAAGVTPVMGMAPDGGLGFTLADVQTAAAFGWLAALHDKGVEATGLSVVENADATLTVEGSLAAN